MQAVGISTTTCRVDSLTRLSRPANDDIKDKTYLLEAGSGADQAPTTLRKRYKGMFLMSPRDDEG